VIAPVVSGKMLKTTTFKLIASAGRQNPEAFEGGVREILSNGLGEEVGISLTATQSNEEAVEVNAVA
jgi:hypothetical protein